MVRVGGPERVNPDVAPRGGTAELPAAGAPAPYGARLVVALLLALRLVPVALGLTWCRGVSAGSVLGTGLRLAARLAVPVLCRAVPVSLAGRRGRRRRGSMAQPTAVVVRARRGAGVLVGATRSACLRPTGLVATSSRSHRSRSAGTRAPKRCRRLAPDAATGAPTAGTAPAAPRSDRAVAGCGTAGSTRSSKWEPRMGSCSNDVPATTLAAPARRMEIDRLGGAQPVREHEAADDRDRQERDHGFGVLGAEDLDSGAAGVLAHDPSSFAQ